ncbi:MAG: hypothetical protein Kow0059_05090 [Candidatus Sumerlaeia bacterium]
MGCKHRPGAASRASHARLPGWWLVPILAAVAYLPLFLPGNELIYDDHLLIVKNEAPADWSSLVRALGQDYGLQFGEREPRGYWRPLLMLLAAAARRLFGPAPAGYHFISLAVHVLAALALGAAVRAFLTLDGGTAGESAPNGGGTHTSAADHARIDEAAATAAAAGPVALFAALLYALHPLHTESVALFTSLPDKLVVLFTLTGAFVLIKMSDDSQWRMRGATPILGALAAAAAVASKESGAVLILTLGVLALGLAWRGRGGARSRILSAVVLTGVVLIGFFALRGRVLESSGPAPIRSGGLAPFTGTGAARGLWAALLAARLAILPLPSQFFHPAPRWAEAPAFAAAAPWLNALILAALAAAWARAAYRRRWTISLFLSLTGASLYLVMAAAAVLPFAERFVYLAGPIGLAAAGLARWVHGAGGFPRVSGNGARLNAAAMLMWVYLGVCAAQTFQGSARYSTRIGFWTQAQRSAPDLGPPNWGLGFALFDLGRLEEAVEPLQRALALETNPTHRGLAALKLGETLLLLERPAQAIEALDAARRDMPRNPNPRLARVVALRQLGREDEARAELMAVRAAWSDDPRVLHQADALSTQQWTPTPTPGDKRPHPATQRPEVSKTNPLSPPPEGQAVPPDPSR